MKSVYRFLGIAILLLTGCTGQNNKSKDYSRPVEDVYTPLLVSIYEPTAPVLGSDNKYHLIYGLMLTNARELPSPIEKIEVLDFHQNATPLKTYQGDEFKPFLRHLDSSVAENSTIEKDGSRILFVSLELTKESLPKALVHKIYLQKAEVPGSKSPEPLSYDAGSFCVCMREPLVLSPPLKGNGWAIINGCCSFGGVHQTTLLPVNGGLYNAQRFAIDFMKLDDQDRFVEGDPSVPANWHGYNEKVYAVADGTVISALEGLPDQPSGSLPDTSSITIKTITGNHVMLKIDENAYALYAHLKNGGIKVKVGDRVSRGDEIAHLGNSGNTSAPHLHLHLVNTPSPMGSAPIPYVFNTFKVVGAMSSESFYGADNLEGTFGNRKEFTQESHSNQLPLDLAIVDF